MNQLSTVLIFETNILRVSPVKIWVYVKTVLFSCKTIKTKIMRYKFVVYFQWTDSARATSSSIICKMSLTCNYHFIKIFIFPFNE